MTVSIGLSAKAGNDLLLHIWQQTSDRPRTQLFGVFFSVIVRWHNDSPSV